MANQCDLQPERELEREQVTRRLRRRLGLRGVRVGEASHPGPPRPAVPSMPARPPGAAVVDPGAEECFRTVTKQVTESARAHSCRIIQDGQKTCQLWLLALRLLTLNVYPRVFRTLCSGFVHV